MQVQPDWKPEKRVVNHQVGFQKMARENRCRSCNSVEFLHRHHLVPRGQRGDDVESNIIPLCAKCHLCYTDMCIGWWMVAHNIRRSLSITESNYIISKKGLDWLDTHYPLRAA